MSVSHVHAARVVRGAWLEEAYLLVGIHVGEAAAVAGLAALGCDLTNLLLGAAEQKLALELLGSVGRMMKSYRLAKLPGLVF